MKDGKSPLTSLSEDLKHKIVSFLSGVDALRLIETCSTIHQDIPISSLSPPYALTPIQEWSGEKDVPRKGPRVPVLYAKRAHSVTLKSRQWCGDVPSHIYLVAFNQEDDVTDTNTFEDGIIVADSTIVRGKVSQLTISFQPQPFTIYFLWYRGEVVQTNRIMVHTVIFDSPNRMIAKEYRMSCNPVSPLASVLGHVMWQALLARG